MKEVILKIRMQGSFSQIINNVGKLILKEFLNPNIKKKKKKKPSKNSLWPKLVLFSNMCVCEHVCMYLCAHVSICECVGVCVHMHL